jgi:hypothetical protein
MQWAALLMNIKLVPTTRRGEWRQSFGLFLALLGLELRAGALPLEPCHKSGERLITCSKRALKLTFPSEQKG